MNKRIALLYGGAPCEHEVSVMGYNYVSELLKDTDYDILPVYVTKSGEWTVRRGNDVLRAYPVAMNGGGLCTERGFIKIDCAIPLLHGEGGEDGSIQGALECAGIRYVGADACTSAVCIDKTYAKAVAESIGIPTVKSVSPKRHESAECVLTEVKRELGFPAFIKPRRLGSSVGAYPILSEDDFFRCYDLASSVCDGLVIIEKRLTDKRELECAFLEFGGKRIITPPGEILIDGFYGYDEKYGGKTRTAATADVSSKTSRLITKYGERLADALMLRHLGRIDFFLSGDEIFFNEINTFPGFTKDSLYPAMLEEYGVSVRDALVSFVEDACLGRSV